MGPVDSLDYQYRNRCWGNFSENNSTNTVTLSDICGFNVINPEKQQGGDKHSGSSLLTMDVDANNTKDLILGDVSFNNLILLINGDTTSDLTSSFIISQDTAFPKNNSNTSAIDISVFPAGFYLDVNNDNVKDLISSPNCNVGCKNINNVWYYENNNASNNPDFNLITEGFIQEEMIEIGEGAHPVFFDYNSDGLMDIVIGNLSEFDLSSSNNSKSSLFLYKNVGTSTTPSYQLITTDYINISSTNLDLVANQPTKGLAPTFGDLDNDGDDDMLLGDINGKIHLFTNSAGAGNEAVFLLTTPGYSGIDVGNAASPQLIDLNRDSLLDLVIGKRNGTFSYYENTGTSSAPLFTLITDSLGKITTKSVNGSTGDSNPFIIDDNGNYKLFTGSNEGWIYEIDSIDGNLNGTFRILDNRFLDIWEGGLSFISLANVTNDSNLEMIVGNYSGGIAFYQGIDSATIDDSLMVSIEEKKQGFK